MVFKKQNANQYIKSEWKVHITSTKEDYIHGIFNFIFTKVLMYLKISPRKTSCFNQVRLIDELIKLIDNSGGQFRETCP